MSTEVVSRRGEPRRTIPTWRNPMGRYMPQAYGAGSRREFTRRRRDEYLEEVIGEASPTQVRLISHAIAVEWSALVAEHTAEGLTGVRRVDALRIAAEYRRQLNIALWHFQKTTPKPAPAAPSRKTYRDLVAERGK